MRPTTAFSASSEVLCDYQFVVGDKSLIMKIDEVV
jgi:hypothetical protein